MKKRKWMLALVMGCALWLAMSGWGIQSAKADGYNATAAVEYARLHWNDDCPIKAHADNDCAHFVAQCLAAGGINVPDQWYPNHYTSSADNAITWAPSQLSWLTDQGYQLIRPFSNSDVAVGDLVYCTWGNGIEHVYICNAVDNGVPKLAAHTKNRYDYSINNLSTSQRWGLVKLGGAIQQTHLGAHTLGINYPKYKTETTELQNYLNELGYGLVVDGDYGTNTANAVKDFQSKHGLEQDGIFGPASYQALMDELNKNRDTAAPSISNVRITDVGSGEYTICCDVSDNVGVTSVRFPTWCEGQSGEDAIWHEGTITGNTASCRIRCVDHNDRTGCTYYTHIYAYDAAGNSTSVNQDQYGCLAEEMPGRVSVSTYSGTTLQEVTIQWNATNCSDWYDLRIYNASGEEIIGFGQIRSSMFKIELPTGEYQTNVCSVNRNGMWVGCGNVSFSVWEGTAGEAGTDVKAIEADHQRFVFYEKDCTWLEADKIASRSRGTFASITNAVQQEAITKAMGELGCSYWLGAEVYRTGQWRW
ncbi:MAG: peptidoglycan-binding protein, partial [Clostridia bacterium]|nr:peptidoglycan-binding protein [Clostridia bacterium]